MKTLPMTLILTSATLAFAQPAKQPEPGPPARPGVAVGTGPIDARTCFELSKDGKAWSRTPERLCVGSGDKNVELQLETGMPTATQVAVFRFDLTKRARCLDCNKDVFSLSNPSNSVFNALAVTFNGKRNIKTGTETGTVSIGKTKFFYRK